MEEKKTVFYVTFKSKDAELPDWEMTLRTTEPKTESEVESLISYWAEVNDRNKEDYCPVDIMDDLCEDKGWTWEDRDFGEMVISEW